MANLAGKIGINITLSHDNAADLAQAVDSLSMVVGEDFTNGSGDNQAQVTFHDTRTIASAGETHDLNASVLEDAFGVGLALIKLKALYIKNKGASDNLLIGAGGVSSVPIYGTDTDWEVLAAGGTLVKIFPKAAGITIDANNKDLKIAHDGGGNVDYDIVILGCRT